MKYLKQKKDERWRRQRVNTTEVTPYIIYKLNSQINASDFAILAKANVPC
jgi:hypothetical protein